jgi:hypothetical protein
MLYIIYMCTVCIVCMCTAAVLFFKDQMTSHESDDKSGSVDAAPSCNAASLTPDDQRNQRNHHRWKMWRRCSSMMKIENIQASVVNV